MDARRKTAVTAAAVMIFAAAGVPAAGGATMFVVEGAGWGHGVGLGQWGAEGYALHGWSDTQILGHYYPHTTLMRLKTATVRVLLASGVSSVTVGSREPFLLVDARGRQLDVQARTLRFGARLRLGSLLLVPPVRVEAGAAVLSLGGRGYRGTLTLLRDGGRLDVVNTLPLERYLRGVVPAEMPTGWLPAAYRAQAIAARSYALARLGGGGPFDLYPDTRDQVYGGIAAERPPTDAAVADTTGQALTYLGRPIRAYYSSSTGGRTENVHDAFAGRSDLPYLVSVADPYDALSPYHRWRMAVDIARLERTAGFPVLDLHVRRDATGTALTVALIGAHTIKTVTGIAFSRVLGLRSNRFTIAALALDPPRLPATYRQPIKLHGFIRGLTGVSLQGLSPAGTWQPIAHLHTDAKGRFALTMRPRASTAYRLAVQQLPTPPVTVAVAPQLALDADRNVVSGTVQPALPLQVERETRGRWQPLTRLAVGPSGFFRAKLHPGRYRIATGTTRNLAAATSPPLDIRP